MFGVPSSCHQALRGFCICSFTSQSLLLLLDLACTQPQEGISPFPPIFLKVVLIGWTVTCCWNLIKWRNCLFLSFCTFAGQLEKSWAENFLGAEVDDVGA